MDEQNTKLKLTIEEQIQDMVDKGIKFELYSIEEAKRFLKYKNYYFKLKSYAKNYNIDKRTNKYYNLDFAYLVELSELDMYVRQIILELSLDVEHFLKVRLMNDLSDNSLEDGYNIVKVFLRYHCNAEIDIQNKAGKYSFCSDLAEKHLNENNKPEALALWNVVELLSFGNFMELYQLYYQTYPSFNYSDYLKSIKFIRNILGKIPEFRNLNNRDAMMKNPIIHDFVTLLFVYNDIMKVSETRGIRNKKMEDIYKKNMNPKHTNFLN